MFRCICARMKSPFARDYCNRFFKKRHSNLNKNIRKTYSQSFFKNCEFASIVKSGLKEKLKGERTLILQTLTILTLFIF